jgi:hypothetical protein
MSHSGITDLSTTYQKKTQKEHIKDAPDTYIGAVEPDQVKNWSFEGESITFLGLLVSTNSLMKRL